MAHHMDSIHDQETSKISKDKCQANVERDEKEAKHEMPHNPMATLAKMRKMDEESVKMRLELRSAKKAEQRDILKWSDALHVEFEGKARMLEEVGKASVETLERIDELNAKLATNEKSIDQLRFWGPRITVADLPAELLLELLQYLDFIHQQRLRR